MQGLPQTDDATPPVETQTTPDEAANNTEASNTGTATQAATEAQETERKFTQADLDRYLANRVKSGVKAELKRLSGDPEQPNVDDLQRQLSEQAARVRSFEARDAVSDHLTDARHKLNVRTENIRPIQELVIGRLQYDDDGKPSNLKEAIDEVKSLAPTLFDNPPPSINANNGRTAAPLGSDMNGFIRRAAGVG